MTLNSGSRLGSYEIHAAIGAGGMGEVYRARDAKLGRDVALKVLPEAFARDAERMARFQREAKVLASLNHSNIASIYGLEDSGATHALVMELVEGPTLADRITQGPISIDEALRIAKQICEALEYAHERGIVHRDLKPANVKVTTDDVVKVLDFGLAKAIEGDASSMDMANSPTISRMATMQGVLLGTAAYMSPEQAKAKPVDRRADIWAFGCVLYEMLTGTMAFNGETVTDTLAAVIKEEPDWSQLPSTTPTRVRVLLQRCFQKDPKQRLQAIGDARISIDEVLSGKAPEPSSVAAAPASAPVWRRALPWVGGALAGSLVAGLVIWKFAAPAPQAFPVLSYIPPPQNTTFRDFGFSPGPVVVSPDGRQLAFSATDEDGITKLYLRPLDAGKAQAIAGTEDAGAPFWSPDGGSLGFFADQKLKTVNLANGNVQVLGDASCALGGAWSSSGTILFAPNCAGPLDKIPSSGGKPSPATALESEETAQESPAFLPDGLHFLYVSACPYAGTCSSSVWIDSLGSSEQKLVLKDATSPRFASGHLLFIRDNRVFAQAFDPAADKLSGEATAVAEALNYSVSATGVLAYQGGTLKGRMEWFDRSGNLLGSVGPVAEYLSVGLSPDGKRILAEVDDPQSNSSDLWLYPASGGVGTRLTFGPGNKEFAVWSPDGKYIAYTCQPDGKPGICRKLANGSGTEDKVFTFGSGISEPLVVDWSPDGRYLSLNEKVTKALRTETVILPLFGDGKPFQVASVRTQQYGGAFSPDGHWLAYFSYESGRPEVYVVPFPGPGGKFQISQNGGWNEKWDKKGHLYFLSIGNRLMEADMTTSGGSVLLKAIQPLFQLSLPSFADPIVDVSADGSRFLVITSSDPNASRSIGLLLDWQGKLEDNR
jgi:eukaryotic-like serine/threonine-protein kinase